MVNKCQDSTFDIEHIFRFFITAENCLDFAFFVQKFHRFFEQRSYFLRHWGNLEIFRTAVIRCAIYFIQLGISDLKRKTIPAALPCFLVCIFSFPAKSQVNCHSFMITRLIFIHILEQNLEYSCTCLLFSTKMNRLLRVYSTCLTAIGCACSRNIFIIWITAMASKPSS